MEADDGVLAGLSAGKIWVEMSTTDAAKGASPVDCPVSNGCHRAATGNIAILPDATGRFSNGYCRF